MKKRRLKKSAVIILIIFLLFIFLIIGLFLLKPWEKKSSKETKDTKQIKEKYNAKDYYTEFASIKEDTKLYKYENKKYIDAGTIYKDAKISLEESKDKYFKIKNSDYYVYYDSFIKSEEKQKDKSYERWVPYNENIEGENLTLLQEDKKLLTIKEKLSLPIYRKTEDKNYVLYKEELYEIKKDEGNTTEKQNSDTSLASSVAVLNYHFFYDPDKGEKCDQIICHTKKQFISHLDYLKENNYTALTAEDLKLFLKKEINVPKTSLVITIDDGYLAELGVELLNEYKMHGTLFLITSWYHPNDFKNEYVKLESHSHDMHNTGVCPKGQGGAIQCWPDDKILNDLKTSQNELGESKVFCFPFYEYNNHSIELLKQAGFEMAFVGGNKKASPGVDLFQIPRYVIGSDTTLEDFKRKIN